MQMRNSFLVVLLLLLVVLTGCSSPKGNDSQVGQPQASGHADYPLKVVDSLNREVMIENEPEKIISLSPAITEILFAIGVEDKIIGVTDFCDYPPEALEKPKVGGFENPNIEAIVNADPDVIFVAAGIQADFIKKFEDLGIKVIALDAESVAQVLENIKLAGVATGAVENAETLVADLEKRINAVREKVATVKERPAVFFEVWDKPLMSAGPGSFIDDLINIAGGTNIASDAVKKFAEFSQETLFERDPDIYILNAHAHKPEDLKKRTGYEGLKAVQTNKVYAIEDDLVTLPGPRIVEGLEEMAKIIHPELFEH